MFLMKQLLLTVSTGHLKAGNGVGTFYLKQVNYSIAPMPPSPGILPVPAPPPPASYPLSPAHYLEALSPTHSRGQQKLGSQVPLHRAGPQTSTTQFALKGSAPGVCICGLEGCQSPQDALQPGSTPGTCPDDSSACRVPGLASSGSWTKDPAPLSVHIAKEGLSLGAGWVSEAGQLQEGEAGRLCLSSLPAMVTGSEKKLQ